MRALVTGGAGFIGSTLVDALLERGDEVDVVDDLSRGRREQVPDGVAFHQLDIVDDRLVELVASVRPELVFHLAAQIDVRRSVSDPMLDTRINVLGTVNVLAAAAAARARRVVFASSGGAIYGDATTLPTPEDHPCLPTSAYGAAKAAGESYGRIFQQLHDLEFIALRYANVYGPRQDPHGEAGVVAIFCDRLLTGQPATINGDGRQTRDYVHVGDVVAANLCAATATTLGAYNIGTGRETSVLEVYGGLAKAAAVDVAPLHGPGKAGEQQRSVLAIDRARQSLGWAPATSLETGLAGTISWFKDRRRQ